MMGVEWMIYKLFSIILTICKVKTKLPDPKNQFIKPHLLLSMCLLGFNKQESSYALHLVGNDIEKAVSLLLQLGKAKQMKVIKECNG